MQPSVPASKSQDPHPPASESPILRHALLVPAAYGVIAGIVSWLIINGADYIIVWTLRKMGRNPRTDTGIQEDVSPVYVGCPQPVVAQHSPLLSLLLLLCLIQCTGLCCVCLQAPHAHLTPDPPLSCLQHKDLCKLSDVIQSSPPWT